MRITASEKQKKSVFLFLPTRKMNRVLGYYIERIKSSWFKTKTHLAGGKQHHILLFLGFKEGIKWPWKNQTFEIYMPLVGETFAMNEIPKAVFTKK
jgi:hypothetical protein